MFSFIESVGMEGAGIALLAADISCKVLLVAGVVWAVMRILGAGDSVVLHRAFTFVLFSMLLMPAFALLVPGITLPIRFPLFSDSDALSHINSEAKLSKALPPRSESPVLPKASSVSLFPTIPDSAEAMLPASEASFSKATKKIVAEAPTIASIKDYEPVARDEAKLIPRLLGILVSIYCIGAIGLVVRLLVGLVQCNSLLRRGRLVQLPREINDQTACATVLESDDLQVPVTIGLWRPWVVLPVDWREWEVGEVAMAVTHEVEHIRRYDTWISILATMNCAIYWFHPLSWYIARRLSDLAEHACDDAVIAATGNRVDYAKKLLSLASRLTPDTPRYSPACVGMARGVSVEQRILRILDCNRPLSIRVGWLKTTMLAVTVLTLALLAAGLRASRSVAAEPQQNTSTATGPQTSPTAESPQDATDVTSKTSIKGRVVSANDESVAGAEVRLLTRAPESSDFDATVAKSDRNGEFTFDKLPTGTHRIAAFRDDRSSRGKRYQALPVKPGDENVVLKLQQAPSLRVKVTDRSSGKPIPDARVRLTWTDTERDHLTDREGRVTLHGLTPEVWTIEVQAKGCAENEHSINLASTDTAEIASELEPGFELFGTITDEKGMPIADAGISVFPLAGRGSQLEYVKTDMNGRYRFPYMPMTGVRLSLLQDGYERVEREIAPQVAAGDEQKLDLTLASLPDGGSVVGVVQDKSGKAVVGALITNHGASSRFVRKTQTDADGKFRLDNVYKSVNKHSLFVSAKGFAPQEVVFQPGTATEPSAVSITLDVGHTITGKVVDKSGRPIEGVNVIADGRPGSGWQLRHSVTTDGDGRFAFDSLAEDERLDFRKVGFSTLQDEKLPLDGNEVVTVSLQDQGRIRGRVVDDATGKAVTPFKVQLTFSPDRKPEEPSSGLSGAAVTGGGEEFANDDGTFELTNLVQGMPLQVSVEAEGYQRAVNRRIVALSDSSPNEFRLKQILVSDTMTVAGQVIDSQAQPLSGIQIRLIVTTEKIPFPRDQFPFNWQMIQTGQTGQQAIVAQFLAATTDSRGRFKFEAVQQGKEVSLAYWGNDIAQNRVHGIERLSTEGQQGLTINANAAGIVQGSIDRASLKTISSIRVSGQNMSLDATLSQDGTTYEIRNVPPGTYELQVYGPDLPKRDGYLESKVLERIPVQVESGKTAIVAVPQNKRPGNLDTSARPKPQQNTPTSQVPKLTSDSPAVEVLGDEMIIHGRVVDEAGVALAGAQLWMDIDRKGKVAEATADQRGEFALRIPKWDPADVTRVYTGTSTIWAYVPGCRIGHKFAYQQLKQSSQELVQVTLERATDTAFIVEDSNGNPVEGAIVEPLNVRAGSYDIPPKPLRKLVGGITDANGRVDLPALGRDRLSRVEIQKEGYGRQHMRLRDSSSAPSVRTIKLRPTGRLEVQLTSDTPVKFEDYGYGIHQEIDGDYSSGAAVGNVTADGRIVVPEFAEGEITLGLHSSDINSMLRPRIPEGIVIHAGETTRVQVAMEKTVRLSGRVQTKPDAKPVPGALVSVSYGSSWQSERAITDSNGEYFVNALSGPVRRALIVTPEAFAQWIVEEQSRNARVTVPSGKETFELTTLELVRAVERLGSLVDHHGQPVANVLIFPVAGNRRYAPGMSGNNGEYKFYLPEAVVVEKYELLDQDRKISTEAEIVTQSPLVLRLKQ